MARHWGASSGGKRDSRGEHDGVPLQAAQDAAKNRLRRCRGRVKHEKGTSPRASPAQPSSPHARQRERERKKGWGGLRLPHITGMMRVVVVPGQAKLAVDTARFFSYNLSVLVMLFFVSFRLFLFSRA